MPAPDRGFLERAWSVIAAAAAEAQITVILGTERLIDDALLISALVINADGSIAGFQDKVQIDPSEEGVYTPGSERRVFQAGPLRFGIAICHEGFRYPETVRWAARRGAHVVFHPHFDLAVPGSYRPTTFADPANSFHEKAALCRAAENTCYFATVNCASRGLSNDVGDRPSGRDAAGVPALRRGRPAHRGDRPHRSDRSSRGVLPPLRRKREKKTGQVRN